MMGRDEKSVGLNPAEFVKIIYKFPPYSGEIPITVGIPRVTTWATAACLGSHAGIIIQYIWYIGFSELAHGYHRTVHVPNVHAPNVHVPNVPVPNVPVPNVLVPNVPAPNVPVPNGLVPNVPAPNVLAPNVPALNVPVPNVPVPNVSVPNVPVPHGPN